MKFNSHFDNGVYGIEAIFDFHKCDVSKFNTEDLLDFVDEIIEIADMEAHGDPMIWEDHNAQELHLQGTSVFQWIKTSNIVIHTLTLTELVMLNLFSCKPFNPQDIEKFGKEFFNAGRIDVTIVNRGNP